jgi:hypothetical protein
MARKPVYPKRRPYPPSRHRALELLASSRDGCTEAVMRAHGFTTRQMVDLVRDGLATAHSQRVVLGRRVIEVARVRITESGRRVLGDKLW